MNLRKTTNQLLGVLALLLTTICLQAQVTTSSMSGKVMDTAGAPLIGATVAATHVPSGTVYGTATNEDGLFYIINMRTGGPYQVEITYTGFSTVTVDGINLVLGQTYVLDETMNEVAIELSGVEVVATRSSILNSNRTGAATNINDAQISALPTINRSIVDFTRLTPQAQANNAFAGRDNRYNNVQIDGANFNNNFGVSTAALPGGGAQPISLDAVQEIQVNIAPYDVRQTNFTGAGINAVTRAGTNNFEGSVYGFYRNQSFNGKYVESDTLPNPSPSNSKTYGARIGGPILKNKLFFFLNGEWESNARPGITFVPSAPGRTGSNVSRTTLDDLNRVKTFLSETYGYETGAIENYAPNFINENLKLLGRLDWNISKDHKFTLRYNQMVATDDQEVNGSSAPNPRSASNRMSQNSYAFENANYGFENSVKSVTAELGSKFGNKVSNQFLVTYTRIQDKRTSNSTPFPFVDIKKDGDAYMSFGYELFSWKNDVINKVTTFTDNVTYTLGKHTLTGGISFDYLTFGNSFQRYGTSYYRYDSLAQFLNGMSPSAFGLTYSLLPDGSDPYSELEFGLGGIYVQDEFRVSDKFKLTGGVRVDQTYYLNDLITNPAVNALKFLDKNGTDTIRIDVGEWPASKMMFSPRVGFYYDLKGDRSLQIRGGTGIFTGRIPFVWYTNLPTNSGMLQNTVERTGAAAKDFLFDPDPAAHLSKLPNMPGTTAPGSIAAIQEDFKLPQVWRSNIALDAKLPWDVILTLEGLYSKDLVNIYQYNANQKGPIGNMNVANGKDTRPFFGADNAARRVNATVSEAMVLTNSDQGSSYSLTAALSKEFSKNLFANVAYTYTNSQDITGNPGSQAASAWSINPSVRGQNDLDLAPSEYAVPHRVIGTLSYRLEYLKNFATTVSLFYQGSHQGRFSYRYTTDFNRDNINSDLIYIPNDPSEITFTDIVSGGNVVFTAQQQSDAFFKYIEQDDYLSANKGGYAERNGSLLPWRNQFDLRFLQDVFMNIGGNNNTLQFSLDILNIGNLLNADWGVRNTTNYSNAAILVPSVKTDGTATFQMARVSNQLPTETFRTVLNTTSTWGMQLGLRYIFE